MAKRYQPSSGSKPDKLMRDALMLELNDEITVIDPATQNKLKIKKYRLVARGLVNSAIKGEVAAAVHIFDRVDGKVMQKIGGEGQNGAIQFENLNVADLTDEQLDALTVSIARRIARTSGSAG
jgi:PHP family Zn ribbon phosphoesterase